ncbi:MAG: hypothetical protein KJ710_01465 [Candidatus Omnitrophica bacterium]|nr:hypothetical protein [Candidatus Omnitrophota bacterium]MBU1922918.1 hypothetical protein [Candidatus Omnitrophota bacterium]
MKRILFVFIAFCFVSSLAFAQDAAEHTVTAGAMDAATTMDDEMVINGYIIDNRCAEANNNDTLSEFVKIHTKQCALMPACIESGYSIYSDGILYVFDTDSNTQIVEFLNNADSKLKVTVVAEQVGDELSLISVENQE